MVRMCEDMHVLPQAGGLLDQDSAFIHFLHKIKEFDRLRKELDDSGTRLQQGA